MSRKCGLLVAVVAAAVGLGAAVQVADPPGQAPSLAAQLAVARAIADPGVRLARYDAIADGLPGAVAAVPALDPLHAVAAKRVWNEVRRAVASRAIDPRTAQFQQSLPVSHDAFMSAITGDYTVTAALAPPNAESLMKAFSVADFILPAPGKPESRWDVIGWVDFPEEGEAWRHLFEAWVIDDEHGTNVECLVWLNGGHPYVLPSPHEHGVPYKPDAP